LCLFHSLFRHTAAAAAHPSSSLVPHSQGTIPCSLHIPQYTYPCLGSLRRSNIISKKLEFKKKKFKEQKFVNENVWISSIYYLWGWKFQNQLVTRQLHVVLKLPLHNNSNGDWAWEIRQFTTFFTLWSSYGWLPLWLHHEIGKREKPLRRQSY
jgi:hypothetical protein